MRSKTTLAIFLGAAFLFCASHCPPAWSQSKEQVDKINKWFDENKERQKGMDEYFKKKPGEMQKVRDDWQKPGEIQKPGIIEIPKGWDAISKVKVPCQQRFRVSSDTLFEFDKATLTPFAVQTLGLLLPEFQKYKNHPVKVEGHTDSIGTDEYNQGLSDRRAQRVYNWFLENEIFTKDALTSVGFGEKRPIAANTNTNGTDNPKGRAQNRRVEIVVNTCVTLDGTEPPEKDPSASQDSSPAKTDVAGGETKATPDSSKDAAESKPVTEETPTGESKGDSATPDAAENKTPSIREQLENQDESESKQPAAP